MPVLAFMFSFALFLQQVLKEGSFSSFRKQQQHPNKPTVQLSATALSMHSTCRTSRHEKGSPVQEEIMQNREFKFPASLQLLQGTNVCTQPLKIKINALLGTGQPACHGTSLMLAELSNVFTFGICTEGRIHLQQQTASVSHTQNIPWGSWMH